MPYCPKCGNKVDETMAFCPTCGTALKGATASSAAPNREKEEKQEKHEKPQKGEYGFVGFLISGLILITIGAFAILDLSSNGSASGQDLVIMLVIIGLIIIVGAVYVATPARKFFRQLIRLPKNSGKA
jgi:uncharacterized membrane protein YvbJ